MSNAVTTTGLELYANKAIKGLTRALAPLRFFSLDFSDELKSPGASLTIPLVTPDEVAEWNRTSNNFQREATTAKSVTLEKATPIITGFAVTPEQFHKLRPAWWEGKADLNVQTIADAILVRVASLITAANYGDEAGDKVSVTLANMGKKAVAKIRAAAVAKNLRPNRSVLALNPLYYSELLADLSPQEYGSADPTVKGVIPGLLGFEAIIEIPTLTEPGFVCHPDAIAIGSAVFRPVSEKPYNVLRTITEPTTGLALTLVEYPDGATGELSETVNCLTASGVGNENALLRIVA